MADLFCSDLSTQAGERLPGTATLTRAYLLLEYDHAWGPKAILESDLPAEVRSFLAFQEGKIRNLKALLVRRRRLTPGEGLNFFAAEVTDHDPVLYAFQFESYQDLLSLDIPAVLARDPRYDPFRLTEPVSLVCTHGRRDRCCARKGRPALETMSKATRGVDAPLVWECSHLGGHRFAANVLCLPHGLLYGRVDEDMANKIVETYQRREMLPDNLRGRTCYVNAVQAAEVFLRQRSGEVSLDAFRLATARETSPGEWSINFRSQQGDVIHQLTLSAEEFSQPVFSSCSLDKQTMPTHYQLVSHEISRGEKGQRK